MNRFIMIFKLLRFVGIADYVRLILWRLGIETTIEVKKPFLTPVKVRFNIVWRFMEKGQWESPQISTILKKIRRGDTIVDIGAWLGMYTLLFSQLVGPSGNIIAFEPDPKARKTLKENLDLNRISNVKVEALAVSDVGKCVTLLSRKWGNSVSSISRYNSDDKNLLKENVTSTSLDAYLSNSRIDGVKVDAEGAELLVMKGSTDILRNQKPWFLVEYEGQYVPEKDRDTIGEQVLSYFAKFTVLDREPNGRTIIFGEQL
jgi:FkbM family methyltransferase